LSQISVAQSNQSDFVNGKNIIDHEVIAHYRDRKSSSMSNSTSCGVGGDQSRILREDETTFARLVSFHNNGEEE
jgi:hypothetical protein